MMKKKAGIPTVLVSAALVALLAACGGGGGGGGGVSYSGVSTPAVIDNQNAGEIAKGVYEGGTASDALSVLASLQGSPADGDSADLPRVQALAEELKAAFFAAEADALPTAGNARAMAMEPQPGSCGGSMTLKQTGETSGTITFDHYGDGMDCTTAPSMHGSVSFSFTRDAAGEPQSFTMTFTALSMTMGEEEFTFNGSMAFTVVSLTEGTFEMTMVMRDDVSGETFKVENYRVVASGNTIAVSGRFYDPAHGFVTLSTPTPLQHDFPGDWPSAGVLRCDGANGTWVQMTFTAGPDQAAGEADTNGDGAADLFFTYYPNAATGQEIVYQP